MYAINGALGSPYSMKIRALMRYRRIPHLWVHGAESRDALTKVRAPVIPVMEYPDGTFHNDSTPLIYDLEARHAERSVIPTDPARAFIAHLIEDFADEWVTKAMFGYRWLEEVDQIQMSRWLAFDAMKGGGLATSQGFAEQFRARQVGRMAIVGCAAENFPLIEASTRAILSALETHVVDNHCLFGTRPSMAEFGMYGQLSQLGVDPTAQAMMRKDYPYSFRWLLHIDDMSDVGHQRGMGYRDRRCGCGCAICADHYRLAGTGGRNLHALPPRQRCRNRSRGRNIQHHGHGPALHTGCFQISGKVPN